MKVGQQVEWLYEPRGGYGYRWWIPATVVRVNRVSVTIEVKRSTDGSPKRLCVLPGKLREIKE